MRELFAAISTVETVTVDMKVTSDNPASYDVTIKYMAYENGAKNEVKQVEKEYTWTVLRRPTAVIELPEQF